MGNPLSAQILLLAATLLTGLALGACYELLRLLRQRLGLLAGLGLDLGFCLSFGAALFLLGMGPGDGRLRLFMPPLALLGMGLWFRLFGGPARRLAGGALDRLGASLGRMLRPLGLPLKKIRFFFKRGFSFLRNWFTITGKRRKKRRSPATIRRREAKETPYEVQTRQLLHQDRDPRHARLRLHLPHQRTGAHRHGGDGPGGAASAGGHPAPGERGTGV
ncbi:MAG: hypothetical protein IKH03_06345 [Oscillospiraceae bacterium]|nr:hypothetical protein [Oscillospiraceae bacterium]